MTAKSIKAPIHKDDSVPHPTGLVLGTTIGGIAGAVAVGAIATVGIPAVIAGVVVGGTIGAIVGKDTAIDINPTEEDKYWRDQHKNQAYFNSLVSYDAYAPAYRFGIEAYTTYVGRDFNEIEPQLARGWEAARGNSRLDWETARLAAKDAYQRLCDRN